MGKLTDIVDEMQKQATQQYSHTTLTRDLWSEYALAYMSYRESLDKFLVGPPALAGRAAQFADELLAERAKSKMAQEEKA